MILCVDNFTITGDVDEIFAFIQKWKGTTVSNSINIPQKESNIDYAKLFGLNKENKNGK